MRGEIPDILLIEDDEVLAEITSFRLELLGYAVKVAARGEEALEIIYEQREPIDLIVIDLAIPGMNGLELIDTLQNDEQTHHIPILVFSTDVNLESVQRAYVAGAKDFLLVPYDPAVLEEKIGTLLQAAQLKS